MTKHETLSLAQAPFAPRYGNFIGGEWVEPRSGRYMQNISPVTGKVVCEVPRSDAKDIEAALDAAHKVRDAWGRTSAAHRSNILLKIADVMEANLHLLAQAELAPDGIGALV